MYHSYKTNVDAMIQEKNMSTPDAEAHYPYLATLIEQGATLEEV